MKNNQDYSLKILLLNYHTLVGFTEYIQKVAVTGRDG